MPACQCQPTPVGTEGAAHKAIAVRLQQLAGLTRFQVQTPYFASVPVKFAGVILPESGGPNDFSTVRPKVHLDGSALAAWPTTQKLTVRYVPNSDIRNGRGLIRRRSREYERDQRPIRAKYSLMIAICNRGPQRRRLQRLVLEQ